MLQSDESVLSLLRQYRMNRTSTRSTFREKKIAQEEKKPRAVASKFNKEQAMTIIAALKDMS